MPVDNPIRDVRWWTIPSRAPEGARTILRLRSASGVNGYGECPFVPAKASIQRSLELVSRDAMSFAGVHIEPEIDGIVNMAMLDLSAKLVHAPLHRFLGGPTRFKVRAMQTLSGQHADELASGLRRGREAGYLSFAVPLPDATARNQGKAYPNAVLARLTALREAGGDKTDFVLLGQARLTPGDAASVAAAVRPLHPLWFDEPCPIGNLTALRKISHENVVPVGFGSSVSHPSMFQDLLRDSLIDVVRPEIGRLGLIVSRQTAALAETYYTAAAPRHSGGPVATAAAIQLAASLPNFFIVEIDSEREPRLWAACGGSAWLKIQEGYAALPMTPGIGIEVDEAALDRLSSGGEA